MADMTSGWVAAPGGGDNKKAALASGLTRFLSDSFAFYLKAHRAHWNVVGSDFEEYHALFGAIYEDVWGAIDDIAENIRKLGALADVNDEVVAAGAAGAPMTDARALTMDLVRFNVPLIEQCKDLFDLATAARSQGIANFLADRQDMHEKWQWQLTSSLKGD